MPIDLVRNSKLFVDLSPRVLGKIAEASKQEEFASGQSICRQHEPGDSMYVVLAGRVKVTIDRGGNEFLLAYLDQGDHFGEMSMLMNGLRSASVTAVMDTRVLRIDQDVFQHLSETLPGFATRLSQTLAHRLQSSEPLGMKRRPSSKAVGLFCATPQAGQMIRMLTESLTACGESVRVVSDSDLPWPEAQRHLLERVSPRLPPSESTKTFYEHLVRLVPEMDRVLVVRDLKNEVEASCVLTQCEQLFLLVDRSTCDDAMQMLDSLLTKHPTLASRIHLTWVLDHDERFAPVVKGQRALAHPDFKLVKSTACSQPSIHQRQAISRVVRFLRGTRIGFALGGGGARGLAHLGALRALDRAGIFADAIAGTSMGAVVGLSYSAGWEPDDAIDCFERDLRPPKWVHRVPHGDAWYMFWKYRTNGWEKLLRPYFGEVRLEQLRIPLCTVGVDLIRGKQVIRDRGDAVDSMIESINIPMISRPVLRDGMALVDGGILNDVPVDVLRPRDVDRVIGIKVSGFLPQRAGANTPLTPPEKLRGLSTLETMFRINEIQRHLVSSADPSLADASISIDTSAFELHDFAKARQLVDLGEAAAEEAIPELQQLLADPTSNRHSAVA